MNHLATIRENPYNWAPSFHVKAESATVWIGQAGAAFLSVVAAVAILSYVLNRK